MLSKPNPSIAFVGPLSANSFETYAWVTWAQSSRSRMGAGRQQRLKKASRLGPGKHPI